MPEPITPRLDGEATARHAADVAQLLGDGEVPADVGAVVRRLGAHGMGDVGVFGFWVPVGSEGPSSVSLELLVPTTTVSPGSTDPVAVEFSRHVVPMQIVDRFAWAIVSGLEPGTRRRLGPLYRALVETDDGVHTLIDPLAASTPFGAFAPSELLDAEDLRTHRTDGDYFQSLAGADGTVPRLGPFATILQVHVPTATASGTLAGLTRRIEAVAAAVESGSPSDADRLWLGWDAIQLMPVEPTIRREAGPHPWEILGESAERMEARVRRPTTTNWGYDIVMGGAAAVNPAILETGRPHELAELAAALHRFPTGPIGLVLDVVFGHADNQALSVMPPAWFTGPDMYGQHLDYRNPVVRAHLLEMQRRKADYGADGIRIDGAQDFTWWDDEHGTVVHDDDFLVEMSDVVQEVAGVRYRPWMIFEDGRPWPRPDWELASTYRAVTDRQPHAFQWGPLTFAHNTPFLFTFWLSKWWRLREIAEFGGSWITGCANHDTLRRGSQVDPEQRINSYLGADLPAVIERAYDHPAATLLFHAFLPGVPMDFLQSIARAPWSFIRNTDDRYAIKVWAEEARFLDWRVPPEVFADPETFVRLKRLGFTDLDLLEEFMAVLAAAVAVHGDAVEPVLAMAETAPRPSDFDLGYSSMVEAAHAWMDDVHDLCTVDRHLGELDPDQVRFDLAARRFRLQRPWLREDMASPDVFDHLHPTTGAAVFWGVRHGPDERILFVANMEGAPREVVPADLADEAAEWTPALASPGVGTADAGQPTVLSDGEGLVFVAGPAR